ncbi:disease resistance protein RPV1-like isoform X2 [Syzygium oleosum]|uniref:disease resistance protein RPV1-like isoform X2 n=1 Tax=Syzygium oleosum TaxID=219896 RepID=UPI0024BB8F8A|nr:disease resistance protein RPV1-like isoform X2 [Syzygium oleosum]
MSFAKELVEMTECMKSAGHVVLPIFYRVEPAHVRYQIGSFGKTFSRLSGKYVEEDVAKWKQALQEVASLKGWDSERTANGHEGELVKMVVRKVLSELKKAFQLVVPEQLIGIDNAVEDILRLLDDNPSATQIVGIHGMGGIGKTTLAKVVYNKLSDQFRYRSFIANIRESSLHKGISCLQNQLISDILKINNQLSNMDEGIRIMESRLKCKKVLLLLDDVDHNDQLKVFVGEHDWFEKGSKIIITTRSRSVLDKAGVNCKYELKEIAEDKSLILFSRHAFLKDSPPREFESLSRDAVSTTGRLPLALEVIGSFLCGHNREFWQGTLKKLKEKPHLEVQEKLRISYNSLNREERQIFLDIACFFIGLPLEFVSHMWDACDFPSRMVIEILSFMSLIKVGDDGELMMHDQLRDLGREIVRQEDYDVPMNRSRLWVHEEALEVLQNTKGIQKDRVQALWLDEGDSQSEFTTEQFETLPNLRLLAVSDGNLTGDSRNLLPKLRCLIWNGCPASVATSFHLENLVILIISDSDISELWEGWSQVAKQLKVLLLANCNCLKVTPDLSAFRNLEKLFFNECVHLEQIHPSIGEAKGLTMLSLEGCEKLEELPQEIGNLEKLKALSISNTAIEEIPACIGSLKKLEELDASDCQLLAGIPDSISHLVNLSSLDLSDCIDLCILPESIGSLVKLERLSLSRVHVPEESQFCPALHHIPNSIGKLELLTELDLSCSGIWELPESIGDLKNLKILNIAHNVKLSSLPSTISKLGNLEELDAMKCESLGGEIPIDGLFSLKILQLSSTCVSGFPDAFDKLSRLEKLDLFDCKMLQSLPQSISRLPSLQHLELSGCDNLQSLPELPACLTVLKVTCQHRTLPQLSHLVHLKELNVMDCRLLESMPELPSKLLELWVHDCDELKELQSLSSLAFLSKLDLNSCGELTEIKGPKALQSLAKLTVSRCGKLSNLDGLEHLSKNLEKLDINGCRSIETLPDLSCFDNLEYLDIRGCSKLRDVQGLEKVLNVIR